ncbi:hypothetical protein [Maribacter aquivivus]|uniref:hypothetical protein n=1 Tax=Maribacter aquivivus TaxID=228958 RepID=UPI00248FA4EA|nr:hypothetical protein [Maribacter aquivivus]
MINTKYILVLFLSFLVISCSEKEKHSFPTEKRFWDIKDYEAASLELNYGYEKDEKLPSLDDPETSILVKKLVDHENYKIVLNDNELGIKHRNGIAEKFFVRWKEMTNIYQAMDLQDNYLYDKEQLAVYEFGLGLQLRYFKLGNDVILESADDPNSVNYHVNSNIQNLVGNFINYLDNINEENAYSEEGKIMISHAIDTYFIDLVELYPNADYRAMIRKIDLMKAKSESQDIKNSLTKLKELIDSKETQE